MSPFPTKCTLYCLFAATSPAAVIYRRGPSNHTCLIAWDRRDDSFRVGQWFLGRPKPSRGGLSPGGEWLVSFLARYRGPFRTWTILSKPPYFTAISLWPVSHTWWGGGWFLSDRELVLRHPDTDCDLAPGFLPPTGIDVLPYSSELKPEIDRRTVTPWRYDVSTQRATWRDPSGHVLERFSVRDFAPERSRGFSSEEEARHRVLIGGWSPIELPPAGWAAFDGNGDLLFSEGGRLFRLARDAIREVDTQAALLAAARCLADFSDLTFFPLQAPYETPGAERVADDHPATGFLPLLDRTTREERRAAKRLRQRIRQEKHMSFP